MVASVMDLGGVMWAALCVCMDLVVGWRRLDALSSHCAEYSEAAGKDARVALIAQARQNQTSCC